MTSHPKTPAQPEERTGSKRQADPAAKGETLVHIKGEPVPRLPHEHDESSHSQASEPRQVIQQAKADLDRGLVDADVSQPMNELYKKSFKPTQANATRAKTGR